MHAITLFCLTVVLALSAIGAPAALGAPGAVKITDRLALGIDPRAIKLHAGHLYLAAGEDGVYIVDLSNPGMLGPVTVYDTPGTALNLEARDNRIYIADGYAGLVVLALTSLQPEPIPALPALAPAADRISRRLTQEPKSLSLRREIAGLTPVSIR